VRAVQIDSQPDLSQYEKPYLKKATTNLSFEGGGVRGRVGNTAHPDVKNFFEGIQGPPVEPDKLPVMGPRGQVLVVAPPLSALPPMGQIGADGLAYARALKADSRTAADLVGMPLDREAYRALPKQRLGIVVRPGYREKAKAAMSRAEQQARAEEQARAAATFARAERTRRRTRAVADAHRAQTLEQPVQRRAAYEATMEVVEAEWAVARGWSEQGASDVATLPGLPPATPGPPAKKKSPAAAPTAGASGRRRTGAAGTGGIRTRTFAPRTDEGASGGAAASGSVSATAVAEVAIVPSVQMEQSVHRVEFALGGGGGGSAARPPPPRQASTSSPPLPICGERRRFIGMM